MIYSKSGDIPAHQYCYVERKYTHDSKEQAEAVCKLLEKEGFGGSGKVFPISTRVEPVFESEKE